MKDKQMIKQTDRGWVDLSNLVYYGGSSNTVNWGMSVGKTVNFQYDDIKSTLTILKHDENNVQYVYISIPEYVECHRIYVGQIRHGQFGSVVKQITSDFRYNIGCVVDGLLIIGRRKIPKYKYYSYICVHDGYSGEIREDHLLRGHGCPVCHNSIGEKQVKEYLDTHKITFIPQYIFDDCKNIKALPFDFYLPDYDACIEYDGIQHFNPIDFAGKGEEWALQQFNELKHRDEIKNTYCRDHNILLYRIKYTQDVNTTLDELFATLKNNTTK